MKKNIFGLFVMLGVVSLLHAEFERDGAKEVVIDKATNLMWQDNSDAKTIKKTWIEAINYCENLIFAGYSDWRLPNINELESIVNYEKFDPAARRVFQNVASDYYWSSTSVVNDSKNAWIVDFYDGHNNKYAKFKNDIYVRCVRDNN